MTIKNDVPVTAVCMFTICLHQKDLRLVHGLSLVTAWSVAENLFMNLRPLCEYGPRPTYCVKLV